MRITNFISNRYIYLCRWRVSSLGVSPSTSVVYPHRSTLDINRDHFMVSAFPETQEAISLTAKRLAEPERLLTAFHLRSTALPLLVLYTCTFTLSCTLSIRPQVCLLFLPPTLGIQTPLRLSYLAANCEQLTGARRRNIMKLIISRD